MSFSESVRSWFVYLGHMSVINPGPYLSVLQSCWNLNVWNRIEALFLSSGSRYLGLSIVFTNDLEYCSVVLCGLHWYFPGVGEQDYHRICCVCRGLPLVRVAGCVLRVSIRVEKKSYIGSWTAPKTTTFGCFEHSICGCLVQVL